MLRHTFFMALSTALRLLTGVVIFILMARMWGPEKFGSFMYWFTITSLLGLIVDYGFGQQLMREIGHDKERTSELMAGVLMAKLLLTLILVVSLVVMTLTPWGLHQDVLLFWVLMGTCIVSSFAEVFNSVFRGLGKYHEETFIAAWVNAVNFGLVMGLLALDCGVVDVAIGFLASRLLFLLLAIRTFIRIVPAGCIKSTATVSCGIKKLISGLPFAAETGFTNFQSQADTLIVQHFLGAGAVGIYQAGLRLMQGANTFAQVLSNVYLPPMAKNAANGRELKILADRLFIQMLMLGVAALLIFGFGANSITHLLYGNRYNDLVPIMPWFGLLLLVRYIAASHGVTLSAVGLQSSRVIAISISLLALIVASSFLIPHFGLLGMLYASITAVVCLSIFYALTLARRGRPLGLNNLNMTVFIVGAGFAYYLISGN